MKGLPFIFLLGTLVLHGQSPRFSFTTDSITVSNSTADVENSFQLYWGELTQAEISTQKSILGKTQNDSDGLAFYPIVPLQYETPYTAVLNGKSIHFTIPRKYDKAALAIVAIHPKTNQVPTNLLKLYIQFSTAVNPINIYKHISLEDSNGNPISRAILPLNSPLLSDDGKTLTLWLEPGRQKRDLGPNTRLGKVLETHQEYHLVINSNLKGQDGSTMQEPFIHSFTTIEADRQQPQVANWNITTPSKGEKHAVTIAFNEVLDYGSLYNSFGVYDSHGMLLSGAFEYTDTYVKFTPSAIWKQGEYTITFNKRIEDTAGNNLERPFDRDVLQELKKPVLQGVFNIK